MKTLDEAHGDVKLGLSVFVPRSVSTSTFTIGRGLGLGVDRLDGSPTQVLGYGSTRVEFRMGRGRSWAVLSSYEGFEEVFHVANILPAYLLRLPAA